MPRTTQRQQQQANLGPVFVSSTGPEISFRDGVMHVAGQPQRPTQAQHYESSNGLTRYTTVEWVDPVSGEKRTSCSCPGWAFRKKGRERSCCHTQELETGIPCGKHRLYVDPIRTAAEAVAVIPKIGDDGGRALRNIML